MSIMNKGFGLIKSGGGGGGNASSSILMFGAQGGSFNPADSTTYYFGNALTANALTTQLRRIYWPKTGTITSITGCIVTSGAGSAENSTLYIRLNNTTDYLITSSLKWNASVVPFQITGLSISVTSNGTDYGEFKLVTPVWATNPTNTSIWGNLIIS